jgi:endoglucanase
MRKNRTTALRVFQSWMWILWMSGAWSSVSCVDEGKGTNGRGDAGLDIADAATPKPFIRRSGTQLVKGTPEEVVSLRGINFTPYHYANWETKTEILNPNHHAKIDYRRVSEMGFNLIRMNLYYQIFEGDDAPYVYKQAGWDFLDENIAWAREYNIHLILGMHVPQGATPSAESSFWTSTDNQSRFKALWRAIAERYHDEAMVIGYDLLNEPHTPSSPSEWSMLAQATIDEIRKVDQNHMVVVARLYGSGGASGPSDLYNFLVDDDNVLYSFHYYFPMNYTHQTAPWTNLGDSGPYPNDSLPQFAGDLIWKNSNNTNPKASVGDSDWSYYEGDFFQITDSKLIAAYPSVYCADNQGIVYFDDLVIEEYDANQTLVRTIWDLPITDGVDWYSWSSDGAGIFEVATNQGHTDDVSLKISGTTSSANFVNHLLRFELVPDYHYRIHGWMKGEGVNASATCQMRLEFEECTVGGGPQHRNKQYLEHELNRYIKFGVENNVPMFVGEFGLYVDNYRNDYGGVNWIDDALDLFDEHQLHFSFYTYHDAAFGIHTATTSPEATSGNTDLVDLFTARWSGKP